MRAKDTLGLSRILSFTKHEMRVQMDEALSKLGLTSAQYGALAALEEHGENSSEGMTNAELARACYVTPQTMVRIIHGLEERGFVRSEAHSEHGLKNELRLTKRALDVLCKAHVQIFALEKKMTKGMSDTAVKQLLKSLESCFHNLKS